MKPSLVGIVGTESVLSNYSCACENIGAQNQDALLEGFQMSCTLKIEGRMTAECSSRILDLQQVLKNKSKVAYTFLQSKMLLRILR